MAHSIFMCRKCEHIEDEAKSEREKGIPSVVKDILYF